MISVILLMFGGIFLGYLFRQKQLKGISRIITFLVWILLFILGINVGKNEKIINGLHTLGLEALILSIGGILGSIILSKILWNYLNKKKEQKS